MNKRVKQLVYVVVENIDWHEQYGGCIVGVFFSQEKAKQKAFELAPNDAHAFSVEEWEIE